MAAHSPGTAAWSICSGCYTRLVTYYRTSTLTAFELVLPRQYTQLSHNSPHTLGDKCRHSYHRAVACLGGLLWAACCRTVLQTCHALVGQRSPGSQMEVCCPLPSHIGKIFEIPYTRVNKRMRLFSKLQGNMRLIPNMRLIVKGKIDHTSKTATL